MKTFLMFRSLGSVLGLLLMGSCATENGAHRRLPATVVMNANAGRGGLFKVMLRLENGDELPFALDTGSPVTMFDLSQASKLGERLDTGTLSNFGVQRNMEVFAAPKLYWQGTLLELTNRYVIAFDFKQIHLSPLAGRPVLGIIGMDILHHYCIQLDFKAGKVRFLDDERANKKAWGTPFPLNDIEDGCFFIRDNLANAPGPGSVIDTGCDADGWLTPESYERWTNTMTLTAAGEVHAPKAVLGGEKYFDLNLRGLEANLLLNDDSHIKFNGIGLHFLSRHLVTLDFPHQLMYLKRTSIDPLYDKDLEAAGESAGNSAFKFLRNLKKKGRLPGWSKTEKAATNRLHFTYHPPNLITCDQLRKKGDSSDYHFEIRRASQDSPWQLQKAWRTDQNGRTLEVYPVP